MNRSLKLTIALAITFFGISFIASYKKMLAAGNNITMPPVLSAFHIYKNDMARLIPADSFKLYELSSPLFSNYAEKQRLIKVPAGTKLKPVGDGLPEFPNGTILVKTFYYFNNAADTAKGKQIIETRVLVKNNNQWNVGSYVWNAQQNDATLQTSGSNKNIAWLDSKGNSVAIKYHIPGNKECIKCHSNNDELLPLGPKMNNLNIDVISDGAKINQLTHLQKLGLMGHADPALYATLPNWRNTSRPLAERARAYFDMNCAHCHSDNGYCARANLFLSYQVPLNATNITNKKKKIVKMMASRQMPYLGVNVVHQEGVELIKAYINSLQ